MQVKNIGKKVLGIVAVLVGFILASKVGAIFFGFLCAIILIPIGFNVSKHPEAYANLAALSQIIGFTVGILVGIKIYKEINK